ncbi:hypothetical protein GGD66_004542 [Bradyrhizobium sp. CIR48]|nr:hypothetical protein [Bradyrhizobium sp. CIR48]
MKQSSGEMSREDVKVCLHVESEYGMLPRALSITVTLRCARCGATATQSKPRRATARLHQLGRSSFEARHAMPSHRTPRTSG